jgi:hypothetical protein
MIISENRFPLFGIMRQGAVSQAYAPLIYGIIQAAITTGVATAIATVHVTGLGIRFLADWWSAWTLAFLTMLPVVLFVSPLIRRCVLALTASTADGGLMKS